MFSKLPRFIGKIHLHGGFNCTKHLINIQLPLHVAGKYLRFAGLVAPGEQLQLMMFSGVGVGVMSGDICPVRVKSTRFSSTSIVNEPSMAV